MQKQTTFYDGVNIVQKGNPDFVAQKFIAPGSTSPVLVRPGSSCTLTNPASLGPRHVWAGARISRHQEAWLIAELLRKTGRSEKLVGLGDRGNVGCSTSAKVHRSMGCLPVEVEAF